MLPGKQPESTSALGPKSDERTGDLESKIDMLQSLNQNLTFSNQFMAAIFDSAPTAMLVVDCSFRIIKVNRNFERYFTPAGFSCIGLDILEFFSGIGRKICNEKEFLRFVQKSVSEKEVALTTELSLRDERTSRFQVTSTPVSEGKGVFLGRFYNFHNATDEVIQATILEEKNKELESFVYTISHDLKNPISVIIGVTELMDSHFKSFLDKDGAEYITMVKEEAGKMLTLIDDILQISRSQRGKLDLQEVDTLSILNEIVAEFQHVYREFATIFIIQESLPTVWAHPTMLAQVFRNLISNAIKYCDPAKPRAIIEVGYYRKPGYHQFYVRDNGLGMTPEEQSQIFELFFRVGEKNVEGTGLGTTIVKKIIEAHGGRVWIESTKGTGTTFTFTLPEHKAVDLPPSIPGLASPA